MSGAASQANCDEKGATSPGLTHAAIPRGELAGLWVLVTSRECDALPTENRVLKKAKKHPHMVALYALWYNFGPGSQDAADFPGNGSGN